MEKLRQTTFGNCRLGSIYRRGRSPHWIKVKNPKAPAVRREAEEDWGRCQNGSTS
jgi:hypothetical protein